MPIDDLAPFRGTADALARRNALMRLRRRQLLERRTSAMRAATAAALMTSPAGTASR
jgi:hypothetical protein